MKNELLTNHLFTGILLALALITTPLWIPLAMLACLATGKSLSDFNDQANKMSGFDAAE
jgi:hypothetical protein